MTERRLAICIPSYDRASQAMQAVHALLLQIKGNPVQLVVLDNGSPDDYRKVFEADSILAAAMSNGALELIRHAGNVGMSANFLRAFEIALTEWLWLLSDDDHIEPDALSHIMSAIDGAGEAGFLKFSSPRSRPLQSAQTLDSLESFIEFNGRSAHDFNGFIFISNGVYRRVRFHPYLAIGYQHAHTYVPHFMMLTAFMSDRGVCKVLDHEIVKYVVPKTGYSYGLVAGLGVGGLKSLVLAIKPAHAKRFYAIFFPHNDFKVIVDIYFNCRLVGATVSYDYHTGNYIHLASVARGPVRIALLRGFATLGKVPRLFELLLSIVGGVWPRLGAHIEEIRRRYAT